MGLGFAPLYLIYLITTYSIILNKCVIINYADHNTYSKVTNSVNIFLEELKHDSKSVTE